MSKLFHDEEINDERKVGSIRIKFLVREDLAKIKQLVTEGGNRLWNTLKANIAHSNEIILYNGNKSDFMKIILEEVKKLKLKRILINFSE